MMALGVAKLAMLLPRLLDRGNFFVGRATDCGIGESTHGHAQDLDIVVGRHFECLTDQRC